jgi:hypothetical protein
MMAMLNGRLKKVIIRVNVHPLTDEIVGDYFKDEKFKLGFQGWLNSIWQNKDKLITELKGTK